LRSNRSSTHHVEGLTTAASILFAAAVGVCVPMSQLVLAVAVTVVVLATLRGLGFAEHWLGERENDQENDGHFAEDE